MAAFMGMRGTGDWATNQVPENWEQFILREFPNGSAPLFAMQSMFRKENVDSHTFHWWTKTLPTQAVGITAASAVCIDAGLATPYVYASHQTTHGIAGGILYVKITEAFAKECRRYHRVLLRDSDRQTVDVQGRIVDVVYNGASSYIAVKLTEDDDNDATVASYNLATVDRVMLIGTAMPEGSTPPEAIGYDPVEYSNYIQEFRDTLDLTHIALATTLRTGDAYKEAKIDTMELHSIGIEKSGLFGQSSLTVGENKKRIFTSQGMIPFIHTNSPSNVVNYVTDTDTRFAGKTWLEGGKKFLDVYITQLFRYIPGGEVMCFVGDQALLAINDLAEAYGNIQLTPTTKSYGLEVVEWRTPAGRVYFKTHPLFSHETSNQKTAAFFLPKNVKFCPLVGGGYNFSTKWETEMQIPGQHSKVDGAYTVGGWKFYHPNQFMVMYNLGDENAA